MAFTVAVGAAKTINFSCSITLSTCPIYVDFRDGHDKSFCSKAITIIDNFKKPWAIRIIDKSQFFKAISVIDKLLPINFSDKCYGKFSMILTQFFFCKSHCEKTVFLGFSRQESSLWTLLFMGVVLNKTKRDVLKLQQHFKNTVYFFHGANSLTLITVCNCALRIVSRF